MLGSGRGGRGRQIPSRITGDPAKAVGRGEVAAWLDRETGQLPGPGEPTAVPRDDKGPVVSCMPAPYWSIAVLRPGDARLVGQTFVAKYVNTNNTRTAIAEGELSESGRVLLMTHWGFFALVPGVGGTSADGVPVELNDHGLLGFCEMQLEIAGGPITSNYFGFTSGVANQIGGSGLLNEWERSVEIAVPPRTAFRAYYRAFTSRTLSDASVVTGPAIVPTYIGWKYEGWSISQEIWNRYASGVKR